MDVLVIHDDAGCRVRLAKALQAAAHRVPLASSIDEAGEILQFADSPAEAPTVVLVAEPLLGRESAQLHANMRSRFGEIHWIPLHRDLAAGVSADWLSGLDRGLEGPLERAAPAPNVVFIQTERARRHTMARLRFSRLRQFQSRWSEPAEAARAEGPAVQEADELAGEETLAS